MKSYNHGLQNDCVTQIVQYFPLPSFTSGKNVRAMYTPLNPTFIIVKLGFAGVYLFFLFLLQNIDCGYSLEWPPRGGSNV